MYYSFGATIVGYKDNKYNMLAQQTYRAVCRGINRGWWLRPSRTLSSFSSTVAKTLDKDVFTAVKAQPLPGVAVGVTKIKGELTGDCFRNYGVSNHSPDLLKSKPVTRDTVFHIGSLSKNFTALSVMHMVEAEKLNLDAPIQDYLPYLKISSEKEGVPMTTRHLLTHTSGVREFRNYGDILKLILPKKHPGSLRDYYANSKIRTIGEPGLQYIKSHHNFGLAALLVEELTGKQLEDYCAEAVFSPLGMTATGLRLGLAQREALSDQFTLYRQGFKVINAADTAVVGAGGGYSTTSDLVKYIQAFMHPEEAGKGVVSQAIADQMLTPQYRQHEFLPSQALSWNAEAVQFSPKQLPEGGRGAPPLREDVAYLTSGQGMNWSGHQAAMVFSRKTGTGAVVLANSGTHNYAASEISHRALCAALPEYKLGAPASETQGNSSALFPGHSFGPPVAAAAARRPALSRALGLPAAKAGLPTPQLWPRLTGFWQVPRGQALSARLLWLLGGELEVYQLRGKLMGRSLIGPLRANLVRRGPGLVLKAADPGDPLNFTIAGGRLALATPARGTCDLRFDLAGGLLHVGLVTLEHRPWYLSFRYPTMAAMVYLFYNIIGFGRAFDITTQWFILGF